MAESKYTCTYLATSVCERLNRPRGFPIETELRMIALTFLQSEHERWFHQRDALNQTDSHFGLTASFSAYEASIMGWKGYVEPPVSQPHSPIPQEAKSRTTTSCADSWLRHARLTPSCIETSRDIARTPQRCDPASRE